MQQSYLTNYWQSLFNNSNKLKSLQIKNFICKEGKIRLLKQVSCKSLSSENCDFIITGEERTEIEMKFLIHFNKTHDPAFVAKCKDDLIIEYRELIVKLNKIDL